MWSGAVASAALPFVARAAGRADVLLIDHSKEDYLPDLVAAEALGLVGAGTTVLADNVGILVAAGYLEHVEAPARKAPPPGADAMASWSQWETMPAAARRYETRMQAAPFESATELGAIDAMAISRRIG